MFFRHADCQIFCFSLDLPTKIYYNIQLTMDISKWFF